MRTCENCGREITTYFYWSRYLGGERVYYCNECAAAIAGEQAESGLLLVIDSKNKKRRPPHTKRVTFLTKEGTHNGFFVKDINKYIRNVNRWKDTDSGRWYDDKDVIEWQEEEHE